MNDAPTFHPTAETLIRELKQRFPDTPFLALGQTALWDEPTKATLRRTLDTLWPEARLIAAAHDTDYFAKLPGYPAGADTAEYLLVGHDDARTRGLWSAAGEMSRLFGSEDVATRSDLETAGVSLHRALHGSANPAQTLSELTAAWGWTGIIHAIGERKIIRDIPLRDILTTLLSQIEWATGGSADCLEGECAADAIVTAGTIRGWVYTFAQSHPDASLADLYRDLFPRFYELLLGTPPANLATSTTTRLLQFNRQTARSPRFAFVNTFLNPITRRAAIDAYNLAVSGSDTYTLDQFGTGALPFDVVIPGRGRGTLSVLSDGKVIVQTPVPIELCADCNIPSVSALAELLENEFGTDVTLVGKAVALLPMLAAEYILVFHEGGSGYSDRTRAMINRMVAKRIPLPLLRPILRLRYSTWDSLSAIPDKSTTFHLPEHLHQAFGHERITADEFGSCWQYALNQETRRLEELSKLRSPRTMLAYLARLRPETWEPKVREYEASRLRLLGIWDQAQAIQGRIYTLYDQIRALKNESVHIERQKGDDFRARIEPLRQQAWQGEITDDTLQNLLAPLVAERVQLFDNEIEARRSQIRFARATVRDLKERRLALERSEAAITARQTLAAIEGEAEREKARMARNALQTVRGLPHTDFRPSAWWFPLVDPSGSWLRRVSETAVFYTEPLLGDP